MKHEEAVGPGTLDRETHSDLKVLPEKKVTLLKDSKQARADAGLEKDINLVKNMLRPKLQEEQL